MTDAERDQLDADRRKREDELILLLLLLIGVSVPGAIASDDPFGNMRRVLLAQATREIAASMADAHLDAYAFAGGTRFPNRDALIRQYMPTAREAAEAMGDTLSTFADVAELREALRQAGYSRTNTNGLELGAERNIVTAANAGLFLGTVDLLGGVDAITGLRHVSVLDERTTEICIDRANVQLPLFDPYWLTNWPSLHWRCRSVLEPLTQDFTPTEALPTVPPKAGFGKAPPGVLEVLQRRARAA